MNAEDKLMKLQVDRDKFEGQLTVSIRLPSNPNSLCLSLLVFVDLMDQQEDIVKNLTKRVSLCIFRNIFNFNIRCRSYDKVLHLNLFPSMKTGSS